MNFHWPSFLLGYGSGVATVLLGKRLRPVLDELAGTAFELIDKLASRAAMAREDFDDAVAAARARARGHDAKTETKVSKGLTKHSAAAAPRRAAARRAATRVRMRESRR